MPTDCNPDLFEFAPVVGRAVVAAFDGGAIVAALARLRKAETASISATIGSNLKSLLRLTGRE
jgi:hypothetical protein